jgi:CDP-paratose 2-epimerase
MKIMITGSGGLIGSEACLHWLQKGAKVFGLDNNMRKSFFGPMGDVTPNIEMLLSCDNYKHYAADIRSRDEIRKLLIDIKPDVIIHTAAQPSHDKAAQIPYVDFDINAVGTLNMLEGARVECPGCIFIHMSTNKVYGDLPNNLPLIETSVRYDYDPFKIEKFKGASINGINENFSIDQSLHSLFGASKVSADTIAQDYTLK